MRAQTIDFIKIESKHYDLFIAHIDNLTYEIIYSSMLNTYYVDVLNNSILNDDKSVRHIHNKKFKTFKDAIDFCYNFELNN